VTGSAEPVEFRTSIRQMEPVTNRPAYAAPLADALRARLGHQRDPRANDVERDSLALPIAMIL